MLPLDRSLQSLVRLLASLLTAVCSCLYSVSASAQSVLFSDDFNRTSGLGANWQTSSGSYTTDGSHAVSGNPPTSGNWASVVPLLGTDDYSVSSNITVPSGSSSSGLVVRSSAANFDSTLYAVSLNTDGTAQLARRNVGVWTLLSSVSAGILPNVSYGARLLVRGSNPVHLEVWLDGTQRIGFDDDSAQRIISGKSGIANFSQGVKYADFVVNSVPPHLFFDAFNRTTGLGSNWQVLYGTFPTDGTFAVSGSPPPDGDWAVVIPDLGTNDYSVSADVIPSAGSHYAGVAARGTVNGDIYAAQLDTDGSIALHRRDSGTWTQLSAVAATIAPDTSYNLKLIASGATPVHIEAWLNGTRMLAYDDSSATRLQTGQAAIGSYEAGVKFTNFTVDSLSAISVPFAGQGSGTVTAYPAGLSCTGSCAMTVPTGTPMQFAAQADALSLFSGWGGDCSGVGPCGITAGTNQTVQAYVDVANVTVTAVYSVDKGLVTCTPECTYVGNNAKTVVVPSGNSVSLLAQPYGGWEFAGWSGECTGTSSTCNLTPTSNVEIHAVFVHSSLPDVTITVVTNGDGTVYSEPSGIMCPGECSMTVANGRGVNLWATPDYLNEFAVWGGLVYPTMVPSACSVDTLASQTVSATFVSSADHYPCGSQPCTRGQFPPASWRPYGPMSAFNRTIPANPRLMANSSGIIGKMLNTDFSQIKQPANFYLPSDHNSGWPTYYGQASDPMYSIHCQWNAGVPCTVASYPGHAPAGAVAQAASDRHLTFIDQTSRTEYDLWGTTTSPLPSGGGTIVTLWSGHTDVDTRRSDGRALFVGEGNAARVGNLAGRIRVEELVDASVNQSYINHALSVAIQCTNGQSVYPAFTGNSGQVCHTIGLDDVDAPPMGARLFLNMTFEQINALTTVPEWKKVLLRTLSKYGAIVNDTGSDFYFSWQHESGSQYTSMGVPDAWLIFAEDMRVNQADFHVDGSGNYTGLFQDANDGIAWTTTVWSNLQVLDPCVSDGSCNP